MIRIMLAHPSRSIYESLRTALDGAEDAYVVGGVTSVEELHFLLPHVNVVILATELEDATAFDILEEMRMTHPQTKVLVLGIDDRPEVIIHYVEAGAAGYILQDESVADIVDKLQAAYHEEAIVSPIIAAAMMERLNELANNVETPQAFVGARESRLDELTPREMEVLHLINKGYTNQKIANELFIERGTVKNHVHNILKKLDVNNRHDAASIFHAQSRTTNFAVA